MSESSLEVIALALCGALCGPGQQLNNIFFLSGSNETCEMGLATPGLLQLLFMQPLQRVQSLSTGPTFATVPIFATGLHVSDTPNIENSTIFINTHLG